MFVPIKYGWPKGGADVQFNPALLAMVRIMKYGNDPDAHALGIAAGNAARQRILDGIRAEKETERSGA